MALHFSIFAWEIPWTEEPGGLVYGVTKSQTQLSVWACMSHIFLPPSMNHKSSKVTK